MKPRRVFLVGFMGAGKTTVGRALAALLGWGFVDLDDLIERREARSVPQIFEQSGEAVFRAGESSALRELLEQPPAGNGLVAALGGGAYVQPENARLLDRERDDVVFLDADVELLLERCRPLAEARPLFRDEVSFRALYQARRPHYLRAGLHVNVAGKSAEAVAREIAVALGLLARSRV